MATYSPAYYYTPAPTPDHLVGRSRENRGLSIVTAAFQLALAGLLINSTSCPETQSPTNLTASTQSPFTPSNLITTSPPTLTTLLERFTDTLCANKQVAAKEHNILMAIGVGILICSGILNLLNLGLSYRADARRKTAPLSGTTIRQFSPSTETTGGGHGSTKNDPKILPWVLLSLGIIVLNGVIAVLKPGGTCVEKPLQWAKGQKMRVFDASRRGNHREMKEFSDTINRVFGLIVICGGFFKLTGINKPLVTAAAFTVVLSAYFRAFLSAESARIRYADVGARTTMHNLLVRMNEHGVDPEYLSEKYLKKTSHSTEPKLSPEDKFLTANTLQRDLEILRSLLLLANQDVPLQDPQSSPVRAFTDETDPPAPDKILSDTAFRDLIHTLYLETGVRLDPRKKVTLKDAQSMLYQCRPKPSPETTSLSSLALGFALLSLFVDNPFSTILMGGMGHVAFAAAVDYSSQESPAKVLSIEAPDDEAEESKRSCSAEVAIEADYYLMSFTGSVQTAAVYSGNLLWVMIAELGIMFLECLALLMIAGSKCSRTSR